MLLAVGVELASDVRYVLVASRFVFGVDVVVMCDGDGLIGLAFILLTPRTLEVMITSDT